MVGPYSCEWQTDEDRFTVRVSVPPNGKATVVLPGTQVTESGSSIDGVTGVRSIGADERGTLVEVGSGTYEFSARARS